MPGNGFAQGEAEAYNTAGPTENTVGEVLGSRYAINITRPSSRGAHEPQVEPYLLPSVHYRNGNMERVDPAIVHTPLGGMMPGPNAIAPAVMAGHVGAFPCSTDGEFGQGVMDGWPEGPPVPIS